jgi:hypothetical protein
MERAMWVEANGFAGVCHSMRPALAAARHGIAAAWFNS